MKFEKKMSTALEMNAIFEKSMSKNVGVGARPRKCFEYYINPLKRPGLMRLFSCIFCSKTKTKIFSCFS